MVVTDHSPCTAELKRFDSGDFGLAWGGIASLQLGLPAVWTAARERQATAWPTSSAGWPPPPRDRVGLQPQGPDRRRGRRRPRRVRPREATTTVDPAHLHHRNPVTAYAGRTLHGDVRQTWLRGRRIDDDRRPHGELIERGQR